MAKYFWDVNEQDEFLFISNIFWFVQEGSEVYALRTLSAVNSFVEKTGKSQNILKGETTADT